MLEINAFSGKLGERGYLSEAGWKPTSAAFILTVLRAKYPNSFLWPQIEEFKQLNGIPDWQPDEFMNADGTLVAEDGEIYLPDGFDLDGWGDYYQDWKNGYEISKLPPVQTIQMQPLQPAPAQPTYQPTSYEPAPQPTYMQPSQPSQPVSAPVTPAPTMQPAAYQPGAPKPKPAENTIFGLPSWVVIVGGLVGGAVAIKMIGGKKGRKK